MIYKYSLPFCELSLPFFFFFFEVQNFLILRKSGFSVFLFLPIPLESYPRKYCLSYGHKGLLSFFFPKSLIILALKLRSKIKLTFD